MEDQRLANKASERYSSAEEDNINVYMSRCMFTAAYGLHMVSCKKMYETAEGKFLKQDMAVRECQINLLALKTPQAKCHLVPYSQPMSGKVC